jgi:GNAT superfamily N-acetyltransferase
VTRHRSIQVICRTTRPRPDLYLDRCGAEIRVFALGVKPEYQHTGVAAALYRDVWEACRRRGITRAETGWILETNEPMNRAMAALTGKIVKRYRLYESLLRPAPPGRDLATMAAANLGGYRVPCSRLGQPRTHRRRTPACRKKTNP